MKQRNNIKVRITSFRQAIDFKSKLEEIGEEIAFLFLFGNSVTGMEDGLYLTDNGEWMCFFGFDELTTRHEVTFYELIKICKQEKTIKQLCTN